MREQRNLIRIKDQYVASLDGGTVGWRRMSIPLHVEFTPDPSKAKAFKLGRATSIAIGKLVRRFSGPRTEEVFVDVEEEIPVSATNPQLQKARQIFENMLAEMKADFRKNREDFYERVYTDLLNTFKKEGNDPFKHGVHFHHFDEFLGKPDPYHMRFIRKFVSIDNGREYFLRTRQAVTPIIRQCVDDDEYQMFEGFILKQTRKIAAIIKDRRIEVSGKVRGTLECEVTFKLSNGSSFEMRTKIVHKVSYLGNYFWQFPTTFHNVVRADGSKFPLPSEAKLKKEF